VYTQEIVLLGTIAVAGFACNWLAWRLHLPAILFLLLAGVLAGPVTGLLRPDELFAGLLTPMVSVAVAIILFEGSLTLRLREIRGHGTVVSNLVSFGVAVTWLASGLTAYYVLGWDPLLAALFGAIVTVSGPTVTMPILRAIRPSSNVSSVLRWESILIDPLGAILALIVFDIIITLQSNSSLTHVAQILGLIIVVGFVLGALGGWLYGLLLRHRQIPDLLREYSALAAVMAVFSLAEYLQSESGFLAVTVMGIWLANMKNVEIGDILSFKESLTLVLIGGLFILLAARLDIDKLVDIGFGAVVVVLTLQFVAGPLRAWISSIGSPLDWREKLFVGWLFPRGIVAAAVSALFAIRLEEMGYPDADQLVPLVFSVIIGTVTIQSLTSRRLARVLKVAEPEPTGVLVVGANPLGRGIAKALQDSGRDVRVTDSHWASIRRARMAGLPVFYGSPISSYAEDHLDLAGLGTLVAVSRQPGLNELSCIRFADDFGRDRVFTMNTRRESGHEKHNVTGQLGGRMICNGEKTVDELVRMLRAGAAVKRGEITESYPYTAFREQYPDAIVLFGIDKEDNLRFPVADEEFEPVAGWEIAAILESRQANGADASGGKQTEEDA
jgi:CPA1 family monovalent cation:H+ antiporter